MKSKKSQVHFAKDIEKVLENVDFSKLGQKVAVKVHFGEKGCNTYIDPKLVRKVFEKIESLGKNATLIECNVLYKGSRTNAKDHIACSVGRTSPADSIRCVDVGLWAIPHLIPRLRGRLHAITRNGIRPRHGIGSV